MFISISLAILVLFPVFSFAYFVHNLNEAVEIDSLLKYKSCIFLYVCNPKEL